MKPLVFLVLAAVATCEPIVYLIRHGEKPKDGGVGLSKKGKERAECVSKRFGEESDYNIKYIIAQQYKDDGSRKRPYLTVKPLAKDLDLEIDTHCDRDDPDCVRDAIGAYNGDGNILICWEHKLLNDIVGALGAKIAEYPGESWDQIWQVPPPYNKVTDIKHERCPGLDDPVDEERMLQMEWQPE